MVPVTATALDGIPPRPATGNVRAVPLANGPDRPTPKRVSSRRAGSIPVNRAPAAGATPSGRSTTVAFGAPTAATRVVALLLEATQTFVWTPLTGAHSEIGR